MWGLMQADGHMVAVGAIYAPYLNGAETYAAATLNPEKQKPWQQVTYLGGKLAHRAGTNGPLTSTPTRACDCCTTTRR